MDGDGCSFFTAPGWVPPLEAAVELLDANTAIQTKKLVECQHSNTNKKKWLDANTAIQTKKTGWMPTQQYKQINWLDVNTAIQTKKTGWMPTQQYKQKKLVGCKHSNTTINVGHKSSLFPSFNVMPSSFPSCKNIISSTTKIHAEFSIWLKVAPGKPDTWAII